MPQKQTNKTKQKNKKENHVHLRTLNGFLYKALTDLLSNLKELKTGQSIMHGICLALKSVQNQSGGTQQSHNGIQKGRKRKDLKVEPSVPNTRTGTVD
eukprot:bmy_16924T0